MASSLGTARVDIGTILCKAFGFSANDVTEIHLHITLDDIVRLEATHVEIKDGEALKVLRRYEVKEVKDGN